VATILTQAALGSGILLSYPQLATIAGVQGVVVYALASALPLFVFSALGPVIRRKCPEGFVLTEWTRQRYGIVAALYLSFLTLVTLFLYMVAELSAIGQVVNTLTGLDGLPVVIVECVVTTIYTGKLFARPFLLATLFQVSPANAGGFLPCFEQLSEASASPSSRTTSRVLWSWDSSSLRPSPLAWKPRLTRPLSSRLA
jgi:hypothetical protein